MALNENSHISKVQEIITQADLELKSVEVNDNTLEIDIGNLLVSESEFDKSKFRNKTEESEYLKDLARNGVQAIINKIWDLPSETMDNMIYAVLPQPTTRLPREKPVPKQKPLTRWEEFAKQKGITKKKKGNKMWDDVLKEWIPRYGYRKAEMEKKKNWLMEVPDNADPYEDQFEKASEAKKERVARNEYLRLRNIAKAKNVNVPNVGITSVNMKSKSEMEMALTQTRLSTASLGKFQKTLPKEKPIPETKKGTKRKLPANDTTSEGIHKDKRRALNLLGKMKKSELDYETAVNKQIRMENVQMSHTGKKKSSSGRRSKHGGRQRGKSEQRALAKGLVPKGRTNKGGKGSKVGSNRVKGRSSGGKRGGKRRNK